MKSQKSYEPDQDELQRNCDAYAGRAQSRMYAEAELSVDYCEPRLQASSIFQTIATI